MNNLEKLSVSNGRIYRITWILILFEETLLECTCNYWNRFVNLGLGSQDPVFELACIYNWITPWISVLMD